MLSYKKWVEGQSGEITTVWQLAGHQCICGKWQMIAFAYFSIFFLLSLLIKLCWAMSFLAFAHLILFLVLLGGLGGWGTTQQTALLYCCITAAYLFYPSSFWYGFEDSLNTSGPAGGQRKTSTFVSFLVIFLIWYFSYVTFKWKDTKSLVIFGDFIPFALSWQWTQRPAGDSMKDMKELLNNLFKTCCQLFLFFSGLISIKGWKLKRLPTYE